MNLTDLHKGLKTSINIQSLSSDSRQKTKRGLYFALPGLTVDGHDFIDQAISNGAVAITHSKTIENPQAGIHYIKVDDVREAMHDISSRFYDYPERKLKILAITGTNGKTTVAKTCYNLAQALGHKVGYIGTLAVEFADTYKDATLTTPDTLELKSIYADMVDAGIETVFQEVSSQGMHMGRVRSDYFRSAAFTNLSHDHLDYHKDMEAYFRAKCLLFKDIEGFRYVNIDDDYGQRLTEEFRNAKEATLTMTYGQPWTADYRIGHTRPRKHQTDFILHIHNHISHKVEMPYQGDFNAANVTLALMILYWDLGIPYEMILKGIPNLPPVDGRMITVSTDPLIIVDFAHTPSAVEAVLSHLQRQLPPGGKLITVFGSAGSRDTLKRPIIGDIIARHSDTIVLTEDDPRHENVQDIISDLITEENKDRCHIVLDRKDAITHAYNLLTPYDTLAILGKGGDQFIYRHNRKDPYEGDANIITQLL